jgi:RNA polymerase sigma-70 factor, ECF subfamily
MDRLLHVPTASRALAYSELVGLSDDEVMASLQTGSHDALAVLFDRYWGLVRSIALRIVRDRGEAEDVAQIVFLDFFRGAAQFDRSKGTTKVWLLQYAYHRALSRKRHLNVRNFYALEGDEQAANVALTVDRPLLGLTSFELRDLLEKGLGSLGDPQRRVIERVSFEGLSMREIAEKTGETLVNVRHHYYRGLRKLRGFIEGSSEVAKAVGGD